MISEIADNRAFDLGMAEQKLDGSEISRAPVDQGSLRASERSALQNLHMHQSPCRLSAHGLSLCQWPVGLKVVAKKVLYISPIFLASTFADISLLGI